MKQASYIDKKGNWRLQDSIIFFVVVCFLTFSAKIFDSLIPGISNFSVFVCLFLSIVCLILWRRRGYGWVPVGATAWILLIAVQKHAFSVKSGISFELSSIGDNSLLIIFVIFFFFQRRPLRIANIIYFISIIYIVYYIYLSLIATADPSIMGVADPSLDAQKRTAYIDADNARGARIFLCGTFAAFTILYALGLTIYERQFIHIIPLALSTWAVYLAQARVFSAILILSVLMMFLKKRQISWLSKIGFGAFVAWFLVMAYGLLNNAFNPFTAYQDDDSGQARYAEYEAAQRIISNDPIFGTGIATTLSPEYQAIANSAVLFSAADIGAIGVWTYFGFAGLVIFLIITYLSFFPGQHIDDLGWYSKVLHAIGFLNGLYGVIAPTLMMDDGRLFFAVVLYSASYWVSVATVVSGTRVPRLRRPSKFGSS